MKVSIITATFNSQATVRDTLESIKSQSYNPIEHIVIDGLSADDTLSIIGEYSHVKKVVSEKDKGIYDAMNKGIGIASGEVIGILNSDDFYAYSDVVSEVVRTFSDTGCDALYADLQYVDRENVTRVTRNWRSGKYSPGLFEYGWMPPHPTFFVKRAIYEKYGVFNLALKSAADYELMLRFIHKHQVKLSYLPSVIVKMRVGGMSNKSLLNRLIANREDRMAWELNELKPRFFTFLLKPVRKLVQFF